MSHRAPALGAPCYVALCVVWENDGRTDTGSGVVCCACAGEGATCCIVVECGVGVGVVDCGLISCEVRIVVVAGAACSGIQGLVIWICHEACGRLG